MARRLVILGSTGSVGRQAVDVAQRAGVRVTALAASRNTARLEEQIRLCRPMLCAVADEEAAKALRIAVADLSVRIIAGPQAAAEAAAISDADMVLNAVSGFSGLAPTLSAIAAGHDVALANKETLVTAGQTVMARAAAAGVRILPVDSEHCAIHQCLCASGMEPMAAGRDRKLRRLILTASGGPFRTMRAEEMRNVTREDALRHPNWKMGPKITVDCATMMNKGYEVIEAARLYGVSADRVDVLIHPQSVVHSMAELTDGAILAQMAVPDMRLCIAYALCWPERLPDAAARLDLTACGGLTFEHPDTERFPLLALAYEALRRGGIAPAVLNAADEIAVGRFLAGEITFPEIHETVAEITDAMTSGLSNAPEPSPEEIAAADTEVRQRLHRAKK